MDIMTGGTTSLQGSEVYQLMLLLSYQLIAMQCNHTHCFTLAGCLSRVSRGSVQATHQGVEIPPLPVVLKSTLKELVMKISTMIWPQLPWASKARRLGRAQEPLSIAWPMLPLRCSAVSPQTRIESCSKIRGMLQLPWRQKGWRCIASRLELRA